MKSLLVLAILIKLGVPQETVLDGDVYVEGIFSLYSSENSECDTVNPFSVQVVEAVKWIYQSLNNEDFLNGNKIGLKVHKTCRSDTKATEIAYNLAKNIETDKKDTVAILGPQYSSEAIPISRLLSSLPDQFRLLQISHSTSAPSLGDHELYSNFFRTIPSDYLQVKTMLGFMQQVNWTYVAVIHDDDTYGREAAQQLLSSSGSKYTCFPEVFSVDTQLSANQMYQQLEQDISSLQSREVPISGIVLIGSVRLLETVLEVISNLFQNDSNYEVPRILTSEGFWSVEQDRSDILNVTKGLFMATPPNRKIVEFEEYWEQNLLGDLNVVRASRYLSDVYNSVKNCDLRDVSANCESLTLEEIKLKFPQPFVVHYAVQAALAIAKAIKGVHTKRCTADVDECRILLINEPKVNYIKELENSGEAGLVNFDDNFGSFRLEVFMDEKPSLVLNFTKQSSDPVYTNDVVYYAVYNKQACKDGTDKFCLKEVFVYRDATDVFVLEENKLTDYDPRTGEEFKLPDIKKPQCPPGRVCTDCHVPPIADLDITEGDLYIVGIAPVHGKSDTPIQCGSVKMGGFDVAEAIKFQLQYEMQHNDWKIPNAKIGSIIIDSCNDPQWVTEKIVNLHRRGIYKNGKYEQVHDKIIGYIASWVSDVSIAVAEILTRLKKVQISYGSTSPKLSNRNLYPYFMRVVQNDENQGKEMLKIVKKIGSNFVQVLYSESAYGKGGMESILKYAQDYDVCVYQSVVCPESKDIDLKVIKENLTHHGTPKIILSFLSSFDVVRLLKTLNEMKGYVIVASEAWGNRDILDDAYNLNGSITLANELPISSNFREHMKSLRANRTLNQPWLQAYMEKNFECYFEWDFDKPSNRSQCGPEDTFNPSLEHDGFKIETWVPFAATALQSLLYGAAEALEEACGNKNTLCDNFRQNPDILIRQIKKLSIPYNGISAKKVFDSNSDGLIAYNRYQIAKNDDGMVEYVEFREDNSWKWPFSVCGKNEDTCKSICYSTTETPGAPSTIEKENSSLVTVVAVLAALLAIILALMVFAVIAFKRQMFCFKVKEDPYLTPGYLSNVSRGDGDGEMISTLSEKEENRPHRTENQYHVH